jgi:hypothetical protein
MTQAVVFRRAARREFDDAAFWYEEKHSGLGSEFTAEIGGEATVKRPTKNWCFRDLPGFSTGSLGVTSRLHQTRTQIREKLT